MMTLFLSSHGSFSTRWPVRAFFTQGTPATAQGRSTDGLFSLPLLGGTRLLREVCRRRAAGRVLVQKPLADRGGNGLSGPPLVVRHAGRLMLRRPARRRLASDPMRRCHDVRQRSQLAIERIESVPERCRFADPRDRLGQDPSGRNARPLYGSGGIARGSRNALPIE